MSDSADMQEKELEPKIQRLKEQVYQRQAVLDHVLELLDKAQSKSQEEPENVRKWDRLLNNLWPKLDEARARLAESTASLDREMHKRQARASRPRPEEPQSPPPTPERTPSPVSFSSSNRPLTGRQFSERRRNQILRSMMDKVIGGQIDRMTFEETDHALGYFSVLEKGAPPDWTHERIRQLLTQASVDVAAATAVMRQRRAELYRRKTR